MRSSNDFLIRASRRVEWTIFDFLLYTYAFLREPLSFLWTNAARTPLHTYHITKKNTLCGIVARLPERNTTFGSSITHVETFLKKAYMIRRSGLQGKPKQVNFLAWRLSNRTTHSTSKTGYIRHNTRTNNHRSIPENLPNMVTALGFFYREPELLS